MSADCHALCSASISTAMSLLLSEAAAEPVAMALQTDFCSHYQPSLKSLQINVVNAKLIHVGYKSVNCEHVASQQWLVSDGLFPR